MLNESTHSGALVCLAYDVFVSQFVFLILKSFILPDAWYFLLAHRLVFADGFSLYLVHGAAQFFLQYFEPRRVELLLQFENAVFKELDLAFESSPFLLLLLP